MRPSETSSYVTVQNQTVAQLALRYLALEGVDKLFGVPGAAVMHLLNELKNQRERFEYVVCRHETGAAYVADGYARVTGKLGVVLVTSGPGATNALTGTMNAQNSHSSLLTITGEVAEQYFGMGYLQEGIDATLDVNDVYRNASRYSSVVTSPSNFPTLFTQALRDALSLPRQAVHVSLPDDIAASPAPDVRFPRSVENYRATPRASSPEQVRQAFERLAAVERPLIFLGNGCREALRGERLDAFVAFVDRFAIPVMTTPDAKGLFPESHPLSLRNYGMAGCRWPAYYLNPALLDSSLPSHYDALLVLGSTLGELATNKWDPVLIPNGPFVQVDLDQSVIGRSFPVEMGIVAEIGAVVDNLVGLGQNAAPDEDVARRRRAFVDRIKQIHSAFVDPAKRDSDANPILPQALLKAINDALPTGSHVFVDAGNCVGWSLHDLVIDPPSQIHSSLAMGPMGFGVGAVIGGKLGAPGSTCIGIVGDGAFLMHGTEVSTAAQYGVGAIWVVLSDDDLAMVSQGMNQFFPDPTVWTHYYRIGRPNVVQFALALGADAYEVANPDDARRVLPEAIRNADVRRKPQVIVARINTAEEPPYYVQPPAASQSH